jgi:hypothetical protein
MKLYATTTSERASKGQGGEYLDIEVKGEDKKTILELHIEEKGDMYEITGYAINAEHAPNRRSESYIKYEVTKGKKQKSETVCKDCGYTNCPSFDGGDCTPI